MNTLSRIIRHIFVQKQILRLLWYYLEITDHNDIIRYLKSNKLKIW